MSKTFNRLSRASGSTQRLIALLSSPARVASRELHAREAWRWCMGVDVGAKTNGRGLHGRH